MDFKNLPSLSRLLINESSLFNRKTKNIEDIETDYLNNELPRKIPPTIENYKQIIEYGSIKYDFDKEDIKKIKFIY